MENDDIPMPSPPDRLRALLTEALVRSGRAERATDRFEHLLQDAPVRPEPEPAPVLGVPGVHLYAVILDRCVDRYEVGMKLKNELGCEKVLAVYDNVWIVAARDGTYVRISRTLNAMFKRHALVLVLEIHGSHSLAAPPSMSDLVAMIKQYN